MDDFYLTLPSTTPSFTNKNTSSVYTTRLPQVLNLEKDKWVVAATDIIYPYSYKNVNKVLKLFIHFKDARQPLCFNLPANQYKNAGQVLSILNANSRKRRNVELLQVGVNDDIGAKIAAGLDAKEREQENVFETIEKTIADSYILAFILTIIVLSNYDKTESPAAIDEEKNLISKSNSPPVEVLVDNTGKKDENNVHHVASDQVEATDGIGAVPEVTTLPVVENPTQTTNDIQEVTPDPVTGENEKENEQSLKEAIEKGLTSSFDKYFYDLFKLQEMESNKRDKAIQEIFNKHSKFLETFSSVNNPKTLSNALNQLTERQAGMLETITSQSNGIGNSIAKSIEDALGNKIISNFSANYKALIKEIDESRLDELIILRNEMHPRTIPFLSNLVQFDLENDLLRIVFKDSEIDFVEFDKECAYFLGFHNCIVRSDELATSSIDFFGNISTLYIYCDIVDQTIVGNYKSSLLTVVPCKGKFGEMIQHTFPVPRYLPLMNSSIDSIKVSILSEFGEPVNFNWGSSIITLHLKKIK